ncbi:YopT-type cysteine protease domain-containing protein [Rahnella aceris]|uniref:YopT-type cysteine protease domain-containing protein n=1 Tax=Rahnella sp. (strain Y9602) TaxID=2703885 RepID=UPI0034608C4C
MYSKNGYSHCIGMSINKGNYKIFDPNLGEFQITKSRSFSSFIFQDWISRKYPPSRTPYLQITQYKSKHLNITTSTAPHIAD